MAEQTGNTPKERKLFTILTPSLEVTIMGLLGGEPQMRYTPGGQAVTSVSVAVSRSYQDKGTSEWKQVKAWYRVSLWRENAERLNAKGLHGGDLVAVVFNPADLTAHAYTDKEGKPAASIELTAQRVVLIASSGATPNAAGTEPIPAGASEEEIPF